MAREKGRNKVKNKLAFLIGCPFLIVGACMSSGIYQPFIFLFLICDTNILALHPKDKKTGVLNI